MMSYTLKRKALGRLIVKGALMDFLGWLLIGLAVIGLWHKLYQAPNDSVGFMVCGFTGSAALLIAVYKLLRGLWDASGLRDKPDEFIGELHASLVQAGDLSATPPPATSTRDHLLFAGAFLLSLYLFLSVLK